jgi:hypothetical protein
MSVNLLAVLLAALSRFALGALWYGPLFVKPWMKEIGKNSMGDASDLPKLLVANFVISLASAYVLAMFIREIAFSGKVTASLAIGLILVGGSIAVNYMFAGRSMKLFLIDAGYHAAAFTLMGVIIGLM